MLFQGKRWEVYKSLVELAKKDAVIKRVNPVALERELDICMLEQEIEISISRLKEEYNIENK